jgi:hypothetical protein
MAASAISAINGGEGINEGRIQVLPMHFDANPGADDAAAAR